MVSARSNLVGRLGVFRRTSARDFSVGFRATVTVELPGVADFPGSFGADAVDGGDEIGVGDSVGGLLELPKIFGEAGDGGGRVVNDFGAVEAEDARAFRKVAVVADVDADVGVTSLEDGVAGVSGSEVK